MIIRPFFGGSERITPWAPANLYEWDVVKAFFFYNCPRGSGVKRNFIDSFRIIIEISFIRNTYAVVCNFDRSLGHRRLCYNRIGI